MKSTSDWRERRNAIRLTNEYTVETLVVADADMVQYHGAEAAQRFILTVMNMVSIYFTLKRSSRSKQFIAKGRLKLAALTAELGNCFGLEVWGKILFFLCNGPLLPHLCDSLYLPNTVTIKKKTHSYFESNIAVFQLGNILELFRSSVFYRVFCTAVLCLGREVSRVDKWSHLT